MIEIKLNCSKKTSQFYYLVLNSICVSYAVKLFHFYNLIHLFESQIINDFTPNRLTPTVKAIQCFFFTSLISVNEFCFLKLRTHPALGMRKSFLDLKE
jgi:hypothetical protein